MVIKIDQIFLYPIAKNLTKKGGHNFTRIFLQMYLVS